MTRRSRLGVLVALWALAVLVAWPAGASAAVTDACNGSSTQNSLTVTATHGKVLYIDSGVTPRLDAAYAAYKVTNSGGARSDVWVALESFGGGVVSLANPADRDQQIAALGGSSSETAFFLLKATQPTAAAQSHVLRVYDRQPTLAGASVLYSCKFTFLKVAETIKASANKVTDLQSSASRPLGATLEIKVLGATGTIGAGRSPDGSIVWLTPAGVSTWPTRALRLESTSVTFGELQNANSWTTAPNWRGGTTQRTLADELIVTSANAGGLPAGAKDYIATYTFRIVGPSAVADVPIMPVAQVASGTQIKHSVIANAVSGATQTLANMGPASIANPLTITKALTGSTGLASYSAMGTTYVEVPYQVGVTSSSATASVLDEIVDTPAAGVLFKGGTASITDVNGTRAVDDPVILAADAALAASPLHFTGPFTASSATAATLTYTMRVPCSTSSTVAYQNSAYAVSGALWITGATASVIPAQSVQTGGSSAACTAGSGAVTATGATVTLDPSVETRPATAVSQSAGSASATLNGLIDGNNASPVATFAYGTSPSLTGATTATATPGSVTGSSPTAVAASLTGLATGTVYYFRAIGTPSGSSATTGEILSFITPEPVGTPTATTASATGITGTTATINGVVDANGTASAVDFIWGTSASLASGTTTVRIKDDDGTASPPDLSLTSTFPADIATSLSALTAGTTYYYRVKATYAAGTALGDIRSFRAGTSQSITFSPIPDRRLDDGAFTVNPSSAPSALAVTVVSDTPGICTVAGSSGAWTVTPGATGTCSLTATQGGDSTYAAADPVTQVFAVLPPPVVTLDSPANGSTSGDATPTVSGTCEGVLTVTVRIYAGASATGSPVQTPTAPCAGGTYTVTSPSLAGGTYTARAEQTDPFTGPGYSTPVTIIIDLTGPSVTSFTTVTSSPTSATSITYTVVFSEAVIGVTAADFDIDPSPGSPAGSGWSIASVAGTGNTRTVTISAASPTAGNVRPRLGTGTVSDEYGNAGPAGVANGPVLEYAPGAPPGITAFLATTASPTNGTTIAYSVTFSESVTGFTGGDVTVSGGSGATGTWVIGAPSGSGAGPYTFSVSNAAAVDGTVVATIAQDAIVNGAAVAGPSSATPAIAVTIDRTAPTVAITSGPADGVTTNATTATLGFTASGSPTGTECRHDTPAGDGTYSPCTSPVAYGSLADGSHTFRVRATDAAGNVSAAATRQWGVDTAAPAVVSFTTTSASPTTATSLTYVIVFTKPVTGLATNDITSFAGTSTGWSAAEVTGTGTTWTLVVSASGPGAGTVIPQLGPGTVTDAYGNTGPVGAASGQPVTYQAVIVPGPPRRVAGAPGNGQVTVSWARPQNASASSIRSYTVTASPGGATCTAVTTTCVTTGLANGTPYTFTVTATGGGGTGPASDPSAPVPPAATGSAGGAPGGRTTDTGRPRPKVTICHVTSSATNPYVVITVDPDSIIKQGHDQHQDGRDIIPPFAYEEKGALIEYPGKNLTERGRALLVAGCRVEAASAVTPAFVPPAAPKKQKVTICHATSSPTNPYVEITIAPEAIVTQGHDQHQAGRDIIPPFSYEKDGVTTRYPGKNWDTGTQELLGNGCRPRRSDDRPLDDGPDAQVVVCHQDGGLRYVRLELAWRVAIEPHALSHAGDIVPPFRYLQDGRTVTYPGHNWDAPGRATFDAGCVAPPSPPGVSTPVEPVVPTTACVAPNEDGTFDAVLGYSNPNATSQVIPRGGGNAITGDAAAGAPVIVGQPESFGPGTRPVVVRVRGVGEDGTVTWTLVSGGSTRTATATISSSRCAEPDPTPQASVRVACVTSNPDGSYDARFGYQSNESSSFSLAAGPTNSVAIAGGAGGDRGQPTVFAPGVTDDAFTVRGVPGTRSVTWTILSGSTARTATAMRTSLPCPGENTPLGELAAPVGIFVTCVMPNADGTYDALFGYVNPNSAAIGVAIGAMNNVALAPGDPGGQGRGQPVLFMPGTMRNAFTVFGIPSSQVATWTLAFQGTRTAAANVGMPVRCVDAPPGPGDPKDPDDPEALVPTPPVGPSPTPATQQLGVYLMCVSRVTRGRYSATFGFINPGADPVSVPAGPSNTVSGGAGADRGQPTYFIPGQVDAAFTIMGIAAAARPAWTITLPNREAVTAQADPTAPQCAATRTDDEKPGLSIRVTTPPRVATRQRTTVTARLRNRQTRPTYDVVLTIPTPPLLSAPTRITSTPGAVCRPPAGSSAREAQVGGGSGPTTCRIAQLLPGAQMPVIRLTTTARRQGAASAVAAATGRSAASARLTAQDAAPLSVVGTGTPVTG